MSRVARSAVFLCVAWAFGPAGAQEEGDDPKAERSTITEIGAKPKPAPPKPAPAPAATPDGGAPAPAPVPPGAPPPAGAPAAKPAPVKPPLTPSKTLTPSMPGARDPASSTMKEVPVPKGQTVNSVKVPGTYNTPGKKGIGETIVEIKCVDNVKTGAVTVEYIAGVKVGQTLTPELLEQARVNLLGVGLFKDVNIYWEEMVSTGGYGVRLIISAKDKLSWIIAPLFAYSPSNIGGGIAYAESNAFGRNKKFLVLGQYTTAEKLLFIAWLDPQIRDSRFYYRIDALVRRDSIVEYASGFQNAPRVSRLTDVDTFGGGVLFGVNLTRRWHLDLRLKIYYDNVQASQCFNTTNEDRSGTPDVVAQQGGYCRRPGSSGWDNTLTMNFGYDGRSKVYGVLHGLQVGVNYQYGPTWLGARQNYHLLTASGMYAWRFWKEHNLLLKLGAEIYIDPPFKLEVEAGGQTMRGSIFRQFRGDTQVRATLEYILPLFTVLGVAVRGIGFYDTNLTWFRHLPPQTSPLARSVIRDHAFRNFLPDTPSGVVRESWHNGVGLGIRMYMKGVVLPLIGVDVAYGFETGSVQVYLALGSNLD